MSNWRGWAAALAIVALFSGVAFAANVRLRAELRGDTIRGLRPGGHGDFEDRDLRKKLSVEIEDVRCPGEVLRVIVARKHVGDIRVNQFNRGDLNLDTDNGDRVPDVEVGDRALVRDNANGGCTGTANKVILSGRFWRD